MALEWIDDDKLIEAVSFLMKKAKEAKESASKNFDKNVIDPFAALFEISGFDLDFPTWHKSEKTRQAQKTLQNHVGDFHQTVIGSVTGWNNMGVGNVIDIVSDSKKVIAEIKNKYNTISGGKLADLYTSLENLVMPKSSVYKDYIAYYVAIIPKNPERYDKVFTPSNKETGSKCSSNELIREIDGASFYSLVTGEHDALRGLFQYLPELIEREFQKTLKSDHLEKIMRYFEKAFD